MKIKYLLPIIPTSILGITLPLVTSCSQGFKTVTYNYDLNNVHFEPTTKPIETVPTDTLKSFLDQAKNNLMVLGDEIAYSTWCESYMIGITYTDFTCSVEILTLPDSNTGLLSFRANLFIKINEQNWERATIEYINAQMAGFKDEDDDVVWIAPLYTDENLNDVQKKALVTSNNSEIFVKLETMDKGTHHPEESKRYTKENYDEETRNWEDYYELYAINWKNSWYFSKLNQ